MWKPNLVRSKRYTMHGPRSSVIIWPETRRLVYAANFAAQIPAVILPLVERDERCGLDSACIYRVMALSKHFSEADKP